MNIIHNKLKHMRFTIYIADIDQEIINYLDNSDTYTHIIQNDHSLERNVSTLISHYTGYDLLEWESAQWTLSHNNPDILIINQKEFKTFIGIIPEEFKSTQVPLVKPSLPMLLLGGTHPPFDQTFTRRVKPKETKMTSHDLKTMESTLSYTRQDLTWELLQTLDHSKTYKIFIDGEEGFLRRDAHFGTKEVYWFLHHDYAKVSGAICVDKLKKYSWSLKQESYLTDIYSNRGVKSLTIDLRSTEKSQDKPLQEPNIVKLETIDLEELKLTDIQPSNLPTINKNNYPHKTYNILDSLDNIPMDTRISFADLIPPFSTDQNINEVLLITKEKTIIARLLTIHHGGIRFSKEGKVTKADFDDYWMKIK